MMVERENHSGHIEVRHLRYFVAAAEHGSFRKAGAAIGIQESAISRRIRDLEDRLGASLFHRNSSGVCLTFAGGRFLRRARQTIRTLGEGAQEVAAVGRGENGSVRIGIYSSIASGFLAELLHAFGIRHGKVRIELIDGNPAEHVAAIRAWRVCGAAVSAKRWQLRRLILKKPSFAMLKMMTFLPMRRRLSHVPHLRWLRRLRSGPAPHLVS
jgi:DNA-binding transcriptional LysR family regulator